MSDVTRILNAIGRGEAHATEGLFPLMDETKAKLVKLRHFASLSLEQAAEILALSPTTAKQYWTWPRSAAARRDWYLIGGGPVF